MTQIVLIVGGTGCASPKFEVEGTWFAGDLHVHTSEGSNDTDGLGTLDVLFETMQTRGLDFVFVTDHSNSAGSMHCDDVEDCPKLGPEFPARDKIADLALGDHRIWVGSEISPSNMPEPNGHVGCLPVDADGDFEAWDGAFIDRPEGAVSGAEALEQCDGIGGFAIVNHPDAITPWIQWDESSDAYDALEVYNGGGRFASWDATTVEDRWYADLRAGRSIVGVGGSDVHRFTTEPPGDLSNPPLGYPTTWVRAESIDTVPEALISGQVVVSEPGGSLDLRAWRAGVGAVGVGRVVEGGRGPTWLRVDATVGASGLRLQVLDVASDTFELDRAVTDGESLSFDLEVSPGIFVARLWPDVEEIGFDVAGVQLTNPIWVE